MKRIDSLVAAAVVSIASVGFAQQAETLPLADFAADGTRYQFGGSRAQIADGGLQLRASAGQTASARLTPVGVEAWNLFAYTRLVLDVENTSDVAAHIRVRVTNPNAVDWARSSIGDGFIPAKTRKPFNVYFFRPSEDRKRFPELAAFAGMNGVPGGFQSHWQTLDAADVRAIELSASAASGELQLTIRSIAAANPAVPKIIREQGDAFFPFVDKYGQYRWAEWGGKITSDEQLLASREAENVDLAQHPRPTSWDEWGGAKDGPQLAKGGFFRVEKVNDRWWFVTPAGHLFFSHGANSVGFDSASTPIAGRERFFADLPPRDGPLGFAYGSRKDANRFDHLQANLGRIFGDGRETAIRTLANDRMASWGLNTIGAWSDGNIIAQRRTPYTAIVHPGYATVAEKLPDVFDPAFADKVRDDVKRGMGTAAGDPWCIGVFIDNELHWGADPIDVISTTLGAPPEKATKRALIEHLKAKLETIGAYNRIAGTNHATWEALLASRAEVKPRSIADLAPSITDFYSDVLTRYFTACKTAVAEAAPGQLYLGCRFHVQGKLLVDIASKYCDVLSFNRYEHSVESFDGYGTDRPILVSEFHFGALDAGMLGTGLKSASDRYDRAAKYQAYVEGALRNPRIVGTHWFAFCPQSITGRGDGENFNTGFFDVCNQPYPEMRDASRAVGAKMYR